MNWDKESSEGSRANDVKSKQGDEGSTGDWRRAKGRRDEVVRDTKLAGGKKSTSGLQFFFSWLTLVPRGTV